MVIKFTVLEFPWTLKVLEEREFVTKFDKYTLGMCVSDEQCIYLIKGFKYKTLLHELTHAYLDYFALEDLYLNPRRQHEFIAEFVSSFNHQLQQKAKYLYKKAGKR